MQYYCLSNCFICNKFTELQFVYVHECGCKVYICSACIQHRDSLREMIAIELEPDD